MTIVARLRMDRRNNDGTRSLRIYVNKDLIWKYYPTGIKLREDQWDEENQIVIGLPRPIVKSYNAKIRALKEQLEEKLNEGIPANQLNPNKPKSSAQCFLLDFINLFIKEANAGLYDITPGTVKNYKSAHTRIGEYCKSIGIKDIPMESINMDWYRSYFLFIQNKQYGSHAFNNHIKIVKRILKESYKRELHYNTIFNDDDFKKIRQKSGDKIYLNADEIRKLENLDLSSMPHLERERDRFLISYYFIMRWEDSTLIRKENVVRSNGLHYAYNAKKTGISCIVPISGQAQQLLEKRNYNFNTDSNQKSNEKIKVIGSIAGINQITNQGSTTAPKSQFITSHTARRSAATNLYLEGMDLETIARLGGWNKIATLKIYLKASGLEVSQNAKKFDFFK